MHKVQYDAYSTDQTGYGLVGGSAAYQVTNLSSLYSNSATGLTP